MNPVPLYVVVVTFGFVSAYGLVTAALAFLERQPWHQKLFSVTTFLGWGLLAISAAKHGVIQ